MTVREEMARAIYAAAFMPTDIERATRQIPSPGWCWEKTSDEMREFALRQADWALEVARRRKLEL